MKITDSMVLFWDGTFSNWHPTNIIDPNTGLTFRTSEQIWMWYKADFFKDKNTRLLLQQDMHPGDAKKLGRQIQNFNPVAWDFVSRGFMEYVNYLKYTQNEAQKKELLETGDKLLVEASPYDKIWGIGLAQEDPRALNPAEWQGKNWLGFALMQVRQEIKKTVTP